MYIDKNPILANSQDSLKNCSKDERDESFHEFMTDCEAKAVDFDKVKDKYCKENNLHLQDKPFSNDVLLELNDELFFIEFKNGIINNGENYKIKLKIYDSLLIILDILNEGISFSRKTISYILVFNNDKKHTSKQYVSSGTEINNLEKNELRFSPNRDKIVSKIKEKTSSPYIQFGLGFFKRLYFKEVSTYNKKQFAECFIEKYFPNF